MEKPVIFCLNCFISGRVIALHDGRCPKCGDTKGWQSYYVREREHPELMEIIQ